MWGQLKENYGIIFKANDPLWNYFCSCLVNIICLTVLPKL